MAKVAVLGGGVAGLTAAHELAERGHAVTVYEGRPVFGGKARSIPVAAGRGTLGAVYPAAAELRPGDLPGEHGFRFFPGFYRHLTDTMRRIPFGGAPDGVAGNLLAASRIHLSRADRRDVVLVARAPRTVADLLLASRSAPELLRLGLTAREVGFFSRKMAVFARTPPEGRHVFEGVSWWDYVEAGRWGENYHRHFCHGLTRSMVAMSPKLASTRTFGTIFLQMMLDIADPRRVFDRVLAGPTNEMWIVPWVRHLQALGVALRSGVSVRRLEVGRGRITRAFVSSPEGEQTVEADVFVLAVPVERAVELMDAPLVAADPRLGNLCRIRTDWMVGIQIYLQEDLPLEHGHTVFADAPWALTAISQRRFWTRGTVKLPPGVGGVLSVDISDWSRPGLLTGRPAREAADALEIVREVLHQMRLSLDCPAGLDDANVVGWFLPPNIRFGKAGADHAGVENDEPLLINTVGSWAWRPEATTALPNLFLASDYVRTTTDIACMEGANEAARAAVGAIVAAHGGAACPRWTLSEPSWLRDWPSLDGLKERVLRSYRWGTVSG